MSFHVSYAGSPHAEACMVAALRRRGLVRSLGGDPTCIFQWAAYSRCKWTRRSTMHLATHAEAATAAAGDEPENPLPFTGCFPIRTLFSSKAGLCDIATLPGVADDAILRIPETFVLRDWLDADEIEGVLAAAHPDWRARMWVLKCADTNNAQGIVVARGERLRSAVAAWKADERFGPESRAGVVQAYVTAPLLYRGRKFHCRVNVLAIGEDTVYVHKDIVCHVASAVWDSAEDDCVAAHVTNHTVQRDLPAYDRPTHTCLLNHLLTQTVAEDERLAHLYDVVFARILRAMQVLFAAATKHAGLRSPLRHKFVRAPHCFEVFGVDVILQPPSSRTDLDASSANAWRDCSVSVLEINVGPALEGEAMPELCAEVVNDTLTMALDPWLEILRSHDATAESPESPQRCTASGSATINASGGYVGVAGRRGALGTDAFLHSARRALTKAMPAPDDSDGDLGEPC